MVSIIFDVDIDILLRFDALREILQCYWNLYSSMLRRAMKTILGANRIRISQRIRIFSWEFQNIAQWLPKSRKHVQIKSRDRKCPFWSGFRSRRPNRMAPFDSSRNSTQKHFSWFFRKFWSDMNCRELQRDFDISGGFCSHYWILHEILSKICASEIPSSKWNGSDPKDRFYFFY